MEYLKVFCRVGFFFRQAVAKSDRHIGRSQRHLKATHLKKDKMMKRLCLMVLALGLFTATTRESDADGRYHGYGRGGNGEHRYYGYGHGPYGNRGSGYGNGGYVDYGYGSPYGFGVSIY
jgi:hypothetical protein